MSEIQPAKAAGGVETLIQRLRQEGVAKGEAEAQALMETARQRADAMLREARAEAERIRSAARQEAERFDASGREALAIAFRDSVIRLRDELTRGFQEEVGRLVGRELEQAEVIRQLLLQLGALCREQARLDEEPAYTVQLPAHLAGLEELRARPEELEHGGLTRLVSSIAGNLLREGVEIHPSPHGGPGIRLLLKGGAMQVELTDRACAALLLEHLQPRFRALLEGVVK
jgi:V/A-type H+-transporting ATPase subunit E